MIATCAKPGDPVTRAKGAAGERGGKGRGPMPGGVEERRSAREQSRATEITQGRDKVLDNGPVHISKSVGWELEGRQILNRGEPGLLRNKQQLGRTLARLNEK